MSNSQPLPEVLVRLRLHLLSLGGHLPVSAQTDYQECVTLLDEALMRARQASENKAPSILTPREKQIFTLLQKGVSNAEIAQQIGVTTGTVKTYLKSVYAKLGVQNRTQAALLATSSRY